MIQEMGAKRKTMRSHDTSSEEVVALRRVWNIFVSLCVVAALLLTAAFLLPKALGMQIYVVTSGSMEPEYPVGSLIYVEDVAPDEIQVGDAITFYMTDSQIVATHQVYEIDTQEGLFRTQGINNRNADGTIMHDAQPVYFDSLIGKPIVCIPYLGYVNQFCTTPPTCYLMLGCVAIIVAVSAIADMTPQRKSSYEKKKYH